MLCGGLQSLAETLGSGITIDPAYTKGTRFILELHG